MGDYSLEFSHMLCKFNLILDHLIIFISLLQRYGVWGDWENPYLTLNPDYEAAQVSASTFCLKYGRLLDICNSNEL